MNGYVLLAFLGIWCLFFFYVQRLHRKISSLEMTVQQLKKERP